MREHSCEDQPAIRKGMRTLINGPETERMFLLPQTYPNVLILVLTIHAHNQQIFDAMACGISARQDADYHLTPHEIRLLKLLVEGHNYKTAAAELSVSVNTIRFHVRSVYEKLQVHSKSEAVVKALRDQIVA